jgi:hypothetical protein
VVWGKTIAHGMIPGYQAFSTNWTLPGFVRFVGGLSGKVVFENVLPTFILGDFNVWLA